MRPTIVFSSSDSSDYEEQDNIQIISTANNINSQKSQNEDSYSYEDYSSEIIVVKPSKPNNLPKRPIISPIKRKLILNPKPIPTRRIIQLDDEESSESSIAINMHKNSDNDNNINSQIRPTISNKEIENQEQKTNKNDTNDTDDEKNKIEEIKDSDFEDSHEKDFEEKSESKDDEEESNPLVVKINYFETKPSITYAISRKLKSSIRGKRYYYYFYSNSVLTFCAKAKTRHPDSSILIYEGEDAHLKGESPFILDITEDSTIFSLKKSNKLDEEMMTLKIFLDSALLMLPRHVDVQIFPSAGSPQILLTTKKPKLSARGHWILDFHDKFTIPSEKNMIFVSSKDENSTELIFIRKISSDGMEIDLCTNISEICVFAIGLSIFLAKLR